MTVGSLERCASRNMQNLLKNLPEDLSSEVIDVLAKSKSVRIERIVSRGQASPAGYWYDQDQAEWVAVIKGEAKLLLEGDDAPVHMQAGDFLIIPAHRRHRVDWTAPGELTIWLAVFFDT